MRAVLLQPPPAACERFFCSRRQQHASRSSACLRRRLGSCRGRAAPARRGLHPSVPRASTPRHCTQTNTPAANRTHKRGRTLCPQPLPCQPAATLCCAASSPCPWLTHPPLLFVSAPPHQRMILQNRTTLRHGRDPDSAAASSCVCGACACCSSQRVTGVGQGATGAKADCSLTRAAGMGGGTQQRSRQVA